MAPESYYFVVSIIAVDLLLLHVINLLYLKATGKTIMGEKVTVKSIGYKKYQNFKSPRGIAVTVVVAIAVVSNFIYDVHRLLNLDKPDYARTMITYAPIVLTVFLVVMIVTTRRRLKSDKSK